MAVKDVDLETIDLSTADLDKIDPAMTGNRTGDELAQVLKDRMPPIARNVVLIDFDDTIKPFGLMFDYSPPFPGIAEFTQELKRIGKTVGIFTSRLSPAWHAADNQDEQEHRNYLQAYCDYFGIVFDFATSEKVPSEAIIDDKAIRFEGDWFTVAKRWGINVTE